MIFFIVSPYPKTGSTLLLEMINQHPAAGDNKFMENMPICHMLNGIGELQKNTSKNFFALLMFITQIGKNILWK
jgi:hypothetical protein